MTTPDRGEFIKLPNERILYTSPSRTSLSLSSPNSFPGSEPFSVKSDSGIVYLTNQRIVYLPTNSTPELSSFSCPILNLKDTYVRAPFFGANYWTALVRPVAGGNIPPPHPYVELRMTFREGGAYDYHTLFEQIKERLNQAVTVAREDGGAETVDYQRVHLEQLPAYEPAIEVGRNGAADSIEPPIPENPAMRDSAICGVQSQSQSPKEEDAGIQTPSEPPPGYEESLSRAVTEDFDERLRREAEHL